MGGVPDESWLQQRGQRSWTSDAHAELPLHDVPRAFHVLAVAGLARDEAQHCHEAGGGSCHSRSRET